MIGAPITRQTAMAGTGQVLSICICFSFLILLASPEQAASQTLSTEVSTLLQIKAALGNSDGAILSSWDSSSSLCRWRNIQWTFMNGTLLDCSAPGMKNNRSLLQDPAIAPYSISLAAAGLNGSIPPELGKLSSLQKLDLSSNRLVGAIPVDLGNSPSLEFLYLSINTLTGPIPSSLWNLCGQIVELRLDHNALSGSIPSPATTNTECSFLQKLDVDSNQLSGSIPSFLGNFKNLSELNLSNNSLSGGIPNQLTELSNLTMLDVADNNLSGEIPAFSSGVNVGASSFTGNPGLCGPPLSTACTASGEHARRPRLDPHLVAGLVIGCLAASVVILAISVAVGHKHNWGRTGAIRMQDANEEGENTVGDGKLVRFEGGEHLTVEEVLNAPGEVLGKTIYGTVYKAKLSGGGMIALRLLREDTVKEQQFFGPAIQQIGLIRYPNIVSLLAYYAGPQGEKLLVYNYLSRGSLADLLYNERGGGAGSRPPLAWARRHKIALGAARGLAYLHHGLHTQIIHGNLKSKNIIVDESFEGHIADYGLLLLMNSGAQQEMLNTAAAQGYKAPELHKMSRASTKTDVYNFGIVLLEILIGKKPKDLSDFNPSDQKAAAAATTTVKGSSTTAKGSSTAVNEQQTDLPTMVKAAVLEERVSELFDLEIVTGMRSVVEDGLLQTLQLAMGCCAPSPAVRPDMKEVVRQLEEIRPKIPTPLYTPTGMKSPRDFPS